MSDNKDFQENNTEPDLLDEEKRNENEGDCVPNQNEDPCVQWKAELEEMRDKLLRRQADFENAKRRLAKEKDDAVRFANDELLKDLVPVLDNFERALKSQDEHQDLVSFKEGIGLIEKNLVDLLVSKWGLQRIEALGLQFDPQKHEAIMMEESNEHKQPMVLESYQTGYMLHDRLLRPAKVKVTKPFADKTNKDD